MTTSPPTAGLEGIESKMTIATEPTSIDALLNELRALIDQNEELEQMKKKNNERREQIESELLSFHKTTGLGSFSSDTMSISFDDTAMRATYEPEHWAEIVAWAVSTGNQHIVQRRLTDAKVLELVDAGTALPPGLSLAKYTKISARRL